MGIGLPEIAIVLLIVVVFFGAKKLPELGKGLGSGMREFKDGIQGKDDEPAAITPPAQAPVTPVASSEPAATPVEAPAPERTDQ
jgi:sec-independent protein translocase protein TatA